MLKQTAARMTMPPLSRASSFRLHPTTLSLQPTPQVLNQTAAWWFGATGHIVPSALLSCPDPNVALMKKCTVFPVGRLGRMLHMPI